MCDVWHCVRCGTCDADYKNDCKPDCKGIYNGNNTRDQCGVCGGKNRCLDCMGVPFGSAQLDRHCRKIDGSKKCVTDHTQLCKKDCKGVWGGSSKRDRCGICGGDNTLCADCAGVPFGRARRDRCGTCDVNRKNDCRPDCAGNFGGNLKKDKCGVCDGHNECLDCKQEVYGDNYMDDCGTCDDESSNDCQEDCNGVLGGNWTLNSCGICSLPKDESLCDQVTGEVEIDGDLAKFNDPNSVECRDTLTLIGAPIGNSFELG